MDETTQNLKKQFDALPSNMQQAISDVNLPEKFQQVVKNNKLMIDQAGKVETETLLVLFGLEPLGNYVNNLTRKAGLSSTQASAVAHDVNELIFKNIRETLKIISEGMIKAEGDATPKPETIVTKEDVLAGIEDPENAKKNEESISLSSLSLNNKEAKEEEIDNGVKIKINNPSNLSSREMLSSTLQPKQDGPLNLDIPSDNDNNKKEETSIENSIPKNESLEIKKENLPEIAPEIMTPSASSLTNKPIEPFHTNKSPVNNIVESKLKEEVVVPKQTVVVEEKTKIPEKPKPTTDAYREPIE